MSAPSGALPRTPGYLDQEEGLARVFAFLTEADRLKSVERANLLMDGSRRENTAEHSWHVALWAMVFGASDRVIAMLVLHDLVEIEAGDQPVYDDHDAVALALAEARAADRLFADWPEARALWDEFEAGVTPDAVMAKRMDHAQPLFQVAMARDPLPAHVAILHRMLASGRIARFHEEWPEAVAAALAALEGRAVGGDLGARLAFLAEADRLKSVLRAGRIHSGRRENSAEHSWHLALFALALAPAQGVDVGRVVRMALIHDLVEVDTGDVPIHAANGQAHHGAAQIAAEQAAADRLFGMLPDGAAFRALWEEFEAAETAESIVAKALDRAQPVWLNICAGGGTWTEYGVTWDQLQTRVAGQVKRGLPEVWAWLEGQAWGYFGP